MENYQSQPAPPDLLTDRDSQPEYDWCQATVIELLLERYKEAEP